ncbi:MAG: 50S ribosomal protein L25 [Planctomycetaceae bacterium]|nr:MAG: 50S ribosomal protein L25 [Planctomycetaceae bacterium]
MAEVLQVKIRQEVGSKAAKRVRLAGQTPAVLYGHQLANVSLAVPADQLQAAIRQGVRMVQLQGDVRDTALIREVQWDAFGSHVLHIDLTRVSATEKVRMVVPLELRGESPGARQGGITEQLIHEVEVESPAEYLPERIEISVNDLNLGGAIKLGDVSMPEHVTMVADADEVVVQCTAVVEAEEEEAEAAETAEPEVIRRPAEGEGEEKD